MCIRDRGGVVAAAVFHVQQQCNIQYVCFQVGVLLVGAQHLQQVFGGGKSVSYTHLDVYKIQTFYAVMDLLNGQTEHLRPALAALAAHALVWSAAYRCPVSYTHLHPLDWPFGRNLPRPL